MKSIFLFVGLIVHTAFLWACPFDNGLFIHATSTEVTTITGSCTIYFTVTAYKDNISLQNITQEEVPPFFGTSCLWRRAVA